MDREKGDSGETESQIEKRASDDTTQSLSPNALKVSATECLNNWIYYLQMLNSLCNAGLRLSQSFVTLSQTQNSSLASQCLASWDELAKSTIVASHTVKTHIAAAMQDMNIGETFSETDAQKRQEHNQQIITENILTFINLQYQFSLAGCECLGTMAMCPSCKTNAGNSHDPDCSMANLQQCFVQLSSQFDTRSQMSSPHYSSDKVVSDSPKSQDLSKSSHSSEYPHQQSPLGMEPRIPSPFNESVRGHSPVHSFADTIRGPGPFETTRGPLPNPGQLHSMKSPFLGRGSRSPLHFPLFPLSGQRRWSEAAAGDVGNESSDSTMRRWSMPWDCGRSETVSWQQRYLPSKLAVPGQSQERSRSTTPEALPQQPGTIPGGEGLAEAIQLLSCRPMRCAIPHSPLTNQPLQGMPFIPPVWPESHDEKTHRRMYGSHFQRGNWQSIDVPTCSATSVTEHYDIFPAGLPHTSRKSSSSTDSSSCLSIHSRSTTSSSERGSDNYTGGGGESLRLHSNMYSIWSGNEHLPFIRLPESQEPQEDSESENTPTEGKTGFPKPI